MQGIGLFGGPGLPYVGSFHETNVRLYLVDEQGRRGVVFLQPGRVAARARARRALGSAAALPVVADGPSAVGDAGHLHLPTPLAGPAGRPVADVGARGRALRGRPAGALPHRPLGPAPADRAGRTRSCPTSTRTGRCTAPSSTLDDELSPRRASATWPAAAGHVMFSPGVDVVFGPRLPA